MTEETSPRAPVLGLVGWGLFALALVVAVGVAVAFRVIDLPLKPLHSDEGVNGWYSLRLWWTGYYHYQASDYHGPMMYYVNLVLFWLFGASDTTLRLGTAMVGALGVASLALYRRSMGAVGVAAAAILLAVLPVDVYFSRTVIHEVYLTTGTMVLVGAGMLWLRRGGVGSAIVAGVALGVMFANKETAVISVGCIGAGAVFVGLLDRVAPGVLRQGAVTSPEQAPTPRRRWPGLVAGFAAFALVMALFYSSFFTFPAGLTGIFTTYGHWVGYGVSGRNQGKEFGYWIQFWPYVWPALVAGVPEMVAGAIRRERMTIFAGIWFLLGFLAYSAIPYKTPWCFINISLPLVLLAGLGVARVVRWLAGFHAVAGAAAILVWLAAVFALSVDSWDQNFERYDDPDLPYVYVQTVREYMPMVELLREIGDESGDPSQLVVVAIDAKNPMRWYLYTHGWERDNFRYYKGYPDGEKDWEKWKGKADLFVCRKLHARKLAAEIGPGYERLTYPNRPGRQVTLFVPDEWMPPEGVGDHRSP